MKKLLNNFRLRKAFLIIFAGLAFVLLMGFANHEQHGKTCTNIYVDIDFEQDNYFVSKEDVISLMTRNGEELIINQYVDKINLKMLEMRVESHNFVDDAQVFKDYKGNLSVKVKQCRPLARILDQEGPHSYIGSNGKILPSSEKFTARVMLIDGAFSGKLKQDSFFHSVEGKKYFDLIKRIDEDKFWKAQLAQMTIQSNGNILFYPQVGDQIIEFGRPDQVDDKFKKLKIFYKKIFPYKGYTRYDRVSLKFKDQIICE